MFLSVVGDKSVNNMLHAHSNFVNLKICRLHLSEVLDPEQWVVGQSPYLPLMGKYPTLFYECSSSKIICVRSPLLLKPCRYDATVFRRHLGKKKKSEGV